MKWAEKCQSRIRSVLGLKALWSAARKKPNLRWAAEHKDGHLEFYRSRDVVAATGEAVAATPAAVEAGGPIEAGHVSPADGGSSGAADLSNV
jgi:hypothetical protein